MKPKTDDERLAELKAGANDPIKITPALLKALKDRKWREDNQPTSNPVDRLKSNWPKPLASLFAKLTQP